MAKPKRIAVGFYKDDEGTTKPVTKSVGELKRKKVIKKPKKFKGVRPRRLNTRIVRKLEDYGYEPTPKWSKELLAKNLGNKRVPVNRVIKILQKTWCAVSDIETNVPKSSLLSVGDITNDLKFRIFREETESEKEFDRISRMDEKTRNLVRQQTKPFIMVKMIPYVQHGTRIVLLRDF